MGSTNDYMPMPKLMVLFKFRVHILRLIGNCGENFCWAVKMCVVSSYLNNFFFFFIDSKSLCFDYITFFFFFGVN